MAATKEEGWKEGWKDAQRRDEWKEEHMMEGRKMLYSLSKF